MNANHKQCNKPRSFALIKYQEITFENKTS